MDTRSACGRIGTTFVLAVLLAGCGPQTPATDLAEPAPPGGGLQSSSIAPVTPPAAIAAPATLPPVAQAVTPEVLVFQLCDPLELVAPIPIAPEPSSVQLALSPTFSWSFPIYCGPARYQIQICADAGCDVPVATGVIVPALTSWVPQSPLDGSTQYFWRVAALADLGDGSVAGPWSGVSSFFTGPPCAAEDLQPPVLTEPEQDALVDAIEVFLFSRLTLRWQSAGACLPSAYQVQLSLNSDFAGQTVTHRTGDPGTSWQLEFDLVGNLDYFWRVAGVEQNTVGPYSETRHFTVIDRPVSDNTPGIINGTIWEDLCDNGLGSDGSIGPTCVIGPELFPIGDGIQEPGEPPLADVGVRVRQGACGDTGGIMVPETTTSADGSYSRVLAAGTYCVELTEGRPDHCFTNEGYWTAPIQTVWPPPSVSVTIAAGQVIDDLNFAYDPLFGSSAYEGQISGKVWNDVDGDGHVDDGEPGMDNVHFWMKRTDGECDPEWSVSTSHGMETADDGSYAFHSLDAGSYCLIVDPNYLGNLQEDAGLWNGAWTPPWSGDGLVVARINLGVGQIRNDVNFGWQYDDQIQTPTFSPPTVTPPAVTPRQVIVPPTPTSRFQFMPTPTPPYQILPTNTHRPFVPMPTRTPTPTAVPYS